MSAKKPILFSGATGIVGRHAVKWFRTIDKEQKIIIAGRNMDLANEISSTAGNASPLTINVEEPDLGIDDRIDIGAVIMLAPDPGLHGLRLAQKRKIPYMSVVAGMVEVAAEVTEYALKCTGPVLLASHWAAGAATFLALNLATQFDSVSTLNIGVILDPKDVYGPAAFEDMERLQAGVPSAFSYVNGRKVWLSKNLMHHDISTIDNRSVTGTSFSSLDTVSLHAVTGAKNIRFDIASEVSSCRSANGNAAAEIVVSATGYNAGIEKTRKMAIEFNQGQSSLTGLCSSLLLNDFIKKWQSDDTPKLYTPESLMLKPSLFLNALSDHGVKITELTV